MTQRGSWGERWRGRDVLKWAWQHLLPLAAVVLAYIAVQGTSDTAEKARRESSRTQGALCALRGDLEKRVAGSREFLREHPEGIPGISAKVIRDGLTNQQRTVKALSSLSCDP